MKDWNASASAQPPSRRLTAVGKMISRGAALALALALVFGTLATTIVIAQEPAPAAKPKPPAKKPATPAATETQQTPPAPQGQAPQGQAPQGQAQAGEPPQLIFSPWTKFCLKPQDANGKQVCFTGKDGRIESGMPVVAAVIIEPEGEPKKILRVTLPLGMQLVHGTRVIVDQNQPMTAPYVICFQNGCMADYEATADLVTKMKKGQGLVIQAINSTGQPISLVLPLSDFGKAYDGPPTDPKVFEAEQNKLQEELQKRADEARKKLEAQQGTAAAPQAGKTP